MAKSKRDDPTTEPDPQAFERFKAFTRRILSVPKSEIQDRDKRDSPSTNNSEKSPEQG